MGTAGKIGIAVAAVAAAGGIAFVITRVMRKRKLAPGEIPASTSAPAMAAMTVIERPPPKPEAPKMAGRKRHSRWSKLRSLGRKGVKLGALAGVPGAGQLQVAGVI
jgi:hypothetical protein